MPGNGHEKPAFIISNDFGAHVEALVSDYARRWRVENGIAQAVKFFHLNAMSSPILTKVHFDVALTMVADTLVLKVSVLPTQSHPSFSLLSGPGLEYRF